MPEYVLQIRIQGQGVVQQFSQEGYKLCFASAVENEGYKVIASSTHIVPNAQFHWNDEFNIAASDSSFISGVQFMAATDVESISLGQSYTLTPDWQGSVSEGGPRDGIRFNNKADRASAIVYRTINGQRAPVYFSSNELSRGSIQLIKPVNRVAVWFQRHGETGTMIDGPEDPSIEIDMSGRNSATVVFSDDMAWSLQ